MIEILKICAVSLGFIVNSIWDIKERKISLKIIIFLDLMGILIRLYQNNLFSVETLLCIIPGIVLLNFSLLTKEKIGYGDGLMMVALGLYSTVPEIISVFLVSIYIAGIVGILLMLFFKKKKNFELPFIPFMYMGYVLVRCLG